MGFVGILAYGLRLFDLEDSIPEVVVDQVGSSYRRILPEVGNYLVAVHDNRLVDGNDTDDVGDAQWSLSPLEHSDDEDLKGLRPWYDEMMIGLPCRPQ